LLTIGTIRASAATLDDVIAQAHYQLVDADCSFVIKTIWNGTQESTVHRLSIANRSFTVADTPGTRAIAPAEARAEVAGNAEIRVFQERCVTTSKNEFATDVP
jgi:hypothetical protein